MNMSLKDKAALVTGGAQGIGLTIAEALALEGAHVFLGDVNLEGAEKSAENLRSQGHKASAVQLNVADPEQVRSVFDSISKEAKPVDILINNAGIAGPSFKTWEYPLEEWQQVIDIDLNGVFYCSKAIVPHMMKANYGRIVNIASIAGKEGNPNAMPYSAAKAGVIALTKSLGKELSDKNIAVNCVTPAAAKTKIFDQISQEHIDYMLSKIPRGRFLKVDELASMVAWLVSEENSYTTGAVFDLSGGRATY